MKSRPLLPLVKLSGHLSDSTPQIPRTVAEFHVASLVKKEVRSSIAMCVACAFLLAFTLFEFDRLSEGELVVRASLLLWAAWGSVKTLWALRARSIGFVSVRVPLGTTLVARQQPDGWVFWEFPDGTRVFSDPTDDQLAWEHTQQRPFSGDVHGV